MPNGLDASDVAGGVGDGWDDILNDVPGPTPETATQAAEKKPPEPKVPAEPPVEKPPEQPQPEPPAETAPVEPPVEPASEPETAAEVPAPDPVQVEKSKADIAAGKTRPMEIVHEATETAILHEEVVAKRSAWLNLKHKTEQVRASYELAVDDLTKHLLGIRDVRPPEESPAEPTPAGKEDLLATTIEEVGLPPGICESLRTNDPPLETVKALEDWRYGGSSFTKVTGLGDKKAERVAEALDAFWGEHPAAAGLYAAGQANNP